MLVTLDTDLKPLSVSVGVGQAVDVVGQAGKPKTITGFQTHTTPVLLSYGERAELATNECKYMFCLVQCNSVDTLETGYKNTIGRENMFL